MTAGASATTQVWFPAGSSWTDYFTGKTYQGGTVQNVTTGLDTMPVFVKSGGIIATRTGQVNRRTWTIAFENAHRPTSVSVNGAKAAAGTWTWDSTSDTRQLFTGTGRACGWVRAA